MEDYKQKYEKALERAKKELEACDSMDCDAARQIFRLFPELKKSKDELMREELIHFLETCRDPHFVGNRKQDEWIKWLEKQGKQELVNFDEAEEEKREFVGDGFVECHANFLDFKEGHTYWFEYIGDDNYNVRSDNLLGKTYHITPCQLYTIFKKLTWLEKQDKQEQLYIRFGEIPTDEKSKIYQGEMEVDTENGVSVYPAFKTNEGDIVLGLNLPITKTTLYTQQHLLEYDDRPCYLVKGTYVGKDTDGQPLINNISIIKKIDSYRVKEEKQGNPTEKVESKFKIGDFIVHNNSGDVCQITEIRDDKYCIWPLYAEIEGYLSFIDVDNDYHLWTINDAKDGDVLVDESKIFIYKWYVNNEIGFYASFSTKGENNLLFDGVSFGNLNTIKNIHPATKEQRDLLFQKIKNAGYKWNADSKRFNWICD